MVLRFSATKWGRGLRYLPERYETFGRPLNLIFTMSVKRSFFVPKLWLRTADIKFDAFVAARKFAFFIENCTNNWRDFDAKILNDHISISPSLLFWQRCHVVGSLEKRFCNEYFKAWWL